MSRRLTNELRNDIANNCIKLTLAKREEDIKKKLSKMGDKVYRHHVPCAIENKMKTFPDGYFNIISRFDTGLIIGRFANGNDDYYSFKSDTMGGDGWRAKEVSLSLSTPRLCSAAMHHSDWNVPFDSLIASELMAIDVEYAKLENDRDALRRQIHEIVYAFTTEAKLLDHWPEGKLYIPEGYEKIKAMIPAPEKINDLIKTVKNAAS